MVKDKMETITMNIFQIYLPGRIHLVSIMIALLYVLLAYLMHPPVHPIYRFMNAMMISVFAHFMYENIFTFFYRLSGYGIDAGTITGIKLYWSITILIASALIYSNSIFNFLDKNRLALCLGLSVILFTNFHMMLNSSWFIELNYWFNGGTDPHNFIWATTKILGFSMWVVLVGEPDESL